VTEIELVEVCHLSFVQKVTRKTCSDSTRSSSKQPSFIESKIIIFNKVLFDFNIYFYNL